MSADSRRGIAWTPEMYWQIREREISHKLQLLRGAVDECHAARQVLMAISETAKIHEPEWEQAQSAAMASLRRAKTANTQLRRMVAAVRDTIRIRPNYAEALTDRTLQTLDNASQLCAYLEAHGF